MKKRFTEGPWVSYDNGNGLSICPKSCEEDLIPNVSAAMNKLAHSRPPEVWSDEAWEEVKENSKLMASAPEMFDLLVDVEQLLSNPDADELDADKVGEKIRSLLKRFQR